MKIAVLGPSGGAMGYSTKRLIEESRSAGLKPEHIPVVDVSLSVGDTLDATFMGRSLSGYDYILLRIDSKRATVGYSVVRFLDIMGVRKPYPAETVLIAHNKFTTLERLAASGIRVPLTYMTGSKSVAREIIGKEKLPMLLKLLSGYGGQGVMVMESREAARSAVETMQTLKQEVLIERFVKNAGEDIRGIIAGDEIIASYKRVAAQGEVRANIHAGGRGEPFKLTREMEEIVFKAAFAVNARICAVDMVEDRGRPCVLEVNINPGLQGIEKATGINVAKRIADFIRKEVRS